MCLCYVWLFTSTIVVLPPVAATHNPMQEVIQQGQPIEQTKIEHPCQNFSCFHDSTLFSDIVIKAADVKVHAHRVVLSAHSSSVAAMLQVSAIPVCSKGSLGTTQEFS